MKTTYTVQRCKHPDRWRLDYLDDVYGPTHASNCAEVTLCGQVVDYKWAIISNTFDGVVTCKKCLKIMKGE